MLNVRTIFGGGAGVNYRPGIPRYVQIADAIRRELRAR